MLILSLALVVVEQLTILGFLHNKSSKKYIGHVLPPSDRNCQLIYPQQYNFDGKISYPFKLTVLEVDI